MPTSYEIDRAAWEALHAAPQRADPVDGHQVRKVGPVWLLIRPGVDEGGAPAFVVVPSSGTQLVEPVPRLVEQQHLALDDPRVVDEVARKWFAERAAVAARVPGTSKVVHLFPDSLPGEAPTGTEPWVRANATGASASIAVGIPMVLTGAVSSLFGGALLRGNDCGSNVCVNHLFGSVFLGVGVANVASGVLLFVLGLVEHAERIEGDDLADRVLLGPPRPPPPPPAPADRPEKTPLGALPPVHSLSWAFEF